MRSLFRFENSFGRVSPFEKGGIKKNYSMTLSFASTLPFLHLGPASLVLVLAGRVSKAFFCPGIDRRSPYPVLSGYSLNLAPAITWQTMRIFFFINID